MRYILNHKYILYRTALVLGGMAGGLIYGSSRFQLRGQNQRAWIAHGHWNAAGHALAAQTIFERLKSEGLIEDE